MRRSASRCMQSVILLVQSKAPPVMLPLLDALSCEYSCLLSSTLQGGHLLSTPSILTQLLCTDSHHQAMSTTHYGPQSRVGQWQSSCTAGELQTASAPVCSAPPYSQWQAIRGEDEHSDACSQFLCWC